MNRKLLFLGCNHNQIPYLKVLRQQDWFIIGVDINPSAPGKKLCHKFYNSGYDDLPALIEIGKKENFEDKDKIFTASSQFAHKGAAHFANYFKIPYPSEKSIDICLNKFKYYRIFEKKGIPIPKTWYLENKKKLSEIIKDCDCQKSFYLKSDYSKNPNYVYKFFYDAVPYEKICWTHDRYFRKYYILQEEFIGDHIRINIYGSRFNVFEFFSDKHTHEYHDTIEFHGIIKKLRIFMENFGLHYWLIKFDVIINKDQFVVLDIGMEPPFRMKKYSKMKDIAFEKYYLDQYLSGNVNYPSSLG